MTKLFFYNNSSKENGVDNCIRFNFVKEISFIHKTFH